MRRGAAGGAGSGQAAGVQPDIVDKIFNPFFTTKPTDKGTGLGLAISNDIIRQHGGSIQVETGPGEFTEMIIQLPSQPVMSVDVEGGTQAATVSDSS